MPVSLVKNHDVGIRLKTPLKHIIIRGGGRGIRKLKQRGFLRFRQLNRVVGAGRVFIQPVFYVHCAIVHLQCILANCFKSES